MTQLRYKPKRRRSVRRGRPETEDIYSIGFILGFATWFFAPVYSKALGDAQASGNDHTRLLSLLWIFVFAGGWSVIVAIAYTIREGRRGR
jgi:hypothetical protein